MHSVLSIDLCSDPARADVVQVEGRNITILESRSGSLGDLTSYLISANTDDREEGSISETRSTAVTDGLGALLGSITTPWNSSVVILPPNDFLSLNLELPFADPKHIGKILSLEVQDRIPFPVGDFLVEHHPLGPMASSTDGAPSHDIHVNIVPREQVRRVLHLCKVNDLEPVIVSTPTAVLGAIYYLAPEYFTPDSAVVYADDPFYYIAIAIGGQLKLDRVIKKRDTALAETVDGGSRDTEVEDHRVRRELLTELKLTLASFENRYSQSIQKVYYVGGSYLKDGLQQSLSRPVEQVSLGTLMSLGSAQNVADGPSAFTPSLATLAAVFAQDANAPAILTNFRIQEFSYSPRLSEVFRGLRAILPYALAALTVGFVALLSVYIIRARHISTLQASIASQIHSALPDAELPPGLEIEGLRGQLNKLQDQLKDLGTLSRFSPLETLIQLTKDIPQGGGITFRAVSIKNNRVKLEGVAPDYAAVDNIAKLLESKKGTYARVKSEVSSSISSGSTGRTFSLEIFMEG